MKLARYSAFALAMALSATACASADHPVSVSANQSPQAQAAAQHLVLTAATTTGALTTGRFTATTTISGGSIGSDLGGPITVNGAFDRAHHATEATVAGSAATESMGLSTVVIDGMTYVKIGDLGEMIGVKTPWVSVDVKALAKSAGLSSKLPGASGTNDPSSFLDLLKGVSTQVTTIGTEPVSGVSTTHMRAEIVPSQALKDLPADRRDELNRALAGLDGALGSEVQQALNTPITVDVWIDAGGHVLKGSESVTEGSLGTVTMSYGLTNLGQPVSIAAPPSSQVTPALDIPLFKTLLGH